MPAVTICTEPFRIPAAAMARAYGFPGYVHVLTAHPVASLTRDEVRRRVTEMLPCILDILGAGE